MRRGLQAVSSRGQTVLEACLQALLLAAAWQLYTYGRFMVRDQRSEAFANAAAVIDLEKQVELFVEPAVQRLAMESRAVIEVLNHYYVYMHVAATIACLGWLYIWHRPAYRACRRVLFIVMPIGLLVHAGFPLAPPRVVPRTGMLDTLAVFGPTIYSRDQFASITNQFAAMPSFHVGWAALVAYYVVRTGSSPLRWAVVAHPLVMTVAVMATANHYLLDAWIGVLLILAAIAVNARIAMRSAPQGGATQPSIRHAIFEERRDAYVSRWFRRPGC